MNIYLKYFAPLSHSKDWSSPYSKISDTLHMGFQRNKMILMSTSLCMYFLSIDARFGDKKDACIFHDCSDLLLSSADMLIYMYMGAISLPSLIFHSSRHRTSIVNFLILKCISLGTCWFLNSKGWHWKHITEAYLKNAM